MKHLFILLSCISLLSADTYAQKNLFVNPYIGAGTAHVNQSSFGGTPLTSNVLSTTGGVNVGMQKGMFRLSIGAALLNTGYRFSNPLTFSNNNQPVNLDSAYLDIVYRHILVPVRVGVVLKTGKLSIIPAVAIAPCYNLGAKSTKESLTTGNKEVDTYPFSSAVYRKLTFSGIASADIAYQLNKHIAVTLGPSYCYMLTNMLKPQPGSPFKATERPYALTANAGAIISL